MRDLPATSASFQVGTTMRCLWDVEQVVVAAPFDE